MQQQVQGAAVGPVEVFEDDKDRLIEHYQEAGYIDFVLKDIRTNQVSPNKITLTFDLSEGRQYKVGSVEFKGNAIFSTNDFLKGVQEVTNSKPRCMEIHVPDICGRIPGWLGSRGTTTAILLITFLAIWSAAHGHGPFAADSPEENARVPDFCKSYFFEHTNIDAALMAQSLRCAR